MSLNYGYQFTYGEDGKRLPAKGAIKRAVDDSIFECEGVRDLKIRIQDETIHLEISRAHFSAVVEVFITREDKKESVLFTSNLIPICSFSNTVQNLIAEAFLDSGKMLIKELKKPSRTKEQKDNEIRDFFRFAFSGI